MAWDAGTITNASPWAQVSSKIQALCGGAGVENWSYLGGIPAGTGTGQSGSAAYSVDVFLCKGNNTVPADISYTTLLAANSTVDGASFVFGSVPAMAANRVYTVAIINSKASAADDPTSVALDGANAPTFTKIKSQASGGASTILKATLWIGKSGASAPAGTNLTVSYGASQTGCIVFLVEWIGLDNALAAAGVDGSGATEVAVQVVSNSGTNQLAHSVTCAALLSVKSIVYMFAGETASAGTYASGVQSGWVSPAGADITFATPSVHARDQFKPDNEDVTGTLTHPSAASMTDWCAIGVELQRKDVVTALGTLNDAGRDFYFLLEIPSPDGAVNSSINCVERGNFTLKMVSSPASVSSAAVPVGTGYWRTLGWYSYAAVPGNNRANSGHQILNTSGFNYWIKMTKNMVVLATKVGSTQATSGVMLLDSFVVNVTDNMPLVLFRSNASVANNIMSFVSLPGVISVSSSATWTGVAKAWVIAVDDEVTTNAANQQDLWAGTKVFVSRAFVAHSAGYTAALPITHGYARGLMKTDVLCVSAGGTINLGDTMVIGGNTWTCVGFGFFGATNSGTLVMVVRAI